jgi:hypothetical protein
MTFADQDTQPPVDLEPITPEDNTVFRLARMLLLLDVARNRGRRIPSLDRLGYYEFFADNPHIVIAGDGRADGADTVALELAGFSKAQLAYASSGPRFVSRRRRLQHDLAQLVAYGLVELNSTGYVITEAGADIAGDFHSAYADAYRTSAEIVLRRLSTMSSKTLERNVEDWLGHSGLLLDLLDEVNDAVVPPLAELARSPRHGEDDNA